MYQRLQSLSKDSLETFPLFAAAVILETIAQLETNGKLALPSVGPRCTDGNRHLLSQRIRNKILLLPRCLRFRLPLLADKVRLIYSNYLLGTISIYANVCHLAISYQALGSL
jgi:hypothetical protein